MEVHRQTCQACGCRLLHNIIAREPGERTVIFVSCDQCEQLVARYVLDGYYHHGKGIESYLRSVRGSFESGRQMLESFEATARDAQAGYQRVLEALAAEKKEP